jgi:hypothetical protein
MSDTALTKQLHVNNLGHRNTYIAPIRDSWEKAEKLRSAAEGQHSTSEHYRSKLIASVPMILIAAGCLSRLKNLPIVRTTVYNESDPTVFEAPALPGFIQQTPDATKLLEFRRHITSLIAHASDETAKIVAIQHWVRGQESDYQFYFARGPMEDDTEEPEKYLEQQRQGRRSACRRFSFILCGALLSAGINARVVALTASLNRSTAKFHDHVVVEVWVEERHKWMLTDPTLDAFVLVDGVPASLLEVYAAAQPGSDARISFNQHGSHYRLPPLNQYRGYFRHLFVARTNAIFDGYRFGRLTSRQIEFVHYAGPGIEPYPQRKKDLLLAGFAVTAGVGTSLIIQCILSRQKLFHR